MRTLLAGLGSFVIIVDGSQSAAQHWPVIRQTAVDLVTALPPASVKALFLLGSNHGFDPYTFNSQTPLPVGGQSLLAPVIRQLRQAERYAELAIVIGNGPVFDLADWLPFPWIERWLLVKVGSDSLRPADVVVTEIAAAELDAAALPPPSPPLSTIGAAEPLSLLSGANYQWKHDYTGFPLLHLPPLQAYWSLFPLTKFQFEGYLCDGEPGYDDSWYEALLAVNNRLSFQQAPWNTYEQLFIAGLRPQEAVDVGQWIGGRLPDVAAWRVAYQWLAEQPPLLPPGKLERQLAPAARAIWYGLYRQLRPSNLLELSLMSGGLYEWVRQEQSYRLLGQPRPAFHESLTHPLRSDPIRPIEPIQRIAHYGLRLIY